MLVVNLSFAQTFQEDNQSDTTLPEDVSSPGAESRAVITEENSQAGQLSPAEQAFQRALEHAKNNELEEAIADCTEAIRLDPENSDYFAKRQNCIATAESSTKVSRTRARCWRPIQTTYMHA